MIEVREEHPLNVPFSIAFTPFGIVNEVRFEQFSNASYPIAVTVSGIVTETKPVSPANDLALMEVVSSAIAACLSSLIVYWVLFFSTLANSLNRAPLSRLNCSKFIFLSPVKAHFGITAFAHEG